MGTKVSSKDFEVSDELERIWPDTIRNFAEIYNPNEHASPFLSFVDIIMNKCNEKDESEYKLFQYIDCINLKLRQEKDSKIVNILIKDGVDFIESDG